jgi:MFS family permease
LKWIIAMGLAFSVLRYVFSAFGGKAGLIAGVVLHGCSFVPVFITAQIYLDQQVDPAWRARAQALMALLNSGIGNLVGYLGAGWWFTTCTQSGGGTRWPMFWGGLAAAVAVVMIYFLAAYSDKDEKQKAEFQKI